jgi:8-oxo-dGTP diphosphatase
MTIKTHFEREGKIHTLTYYDGIPKPDINFKIAGVHSFCFYNNKLVIVRNKKNYFWTPPGGTIEEGENYEQASIREVREESNMKVIYQECIGYQDFELPGEIKTIRQVRMFCVVEPYGDFVDDPDGDIHEIKLIDPNEYKEYIKWGEIGDRLMERALDIMRS